MILKETHYEGTVEEVSQRKNIICSRSFGEPVDTISGIYEAISQFCAIACEKARKQQTKAQSIYVFFRTSPYVGKDDFDAAGDVVTLIQPSNDTCYVTMLAKQLVKKLYRSGFGYKKAGVILLNMQKETILQSDLFINSINENRSLMIALDKINQRFGRRTLCLASEGVNQRWKMKQVYRSPRYTTEWKDLPKVY